ncbi:aliphatic sulfonate ABC transporter substrate-binding protein [Actinoplanes teichomyceticus]|uniref:NitT/TauT family transport system substrate-binding protein n=1 Tax=Actinoplanes teichomyceticus TaxID=1867 RepID=A0A561WL57_ACTTI|nr:aliphatic sulfonate ABC transporter substrate-binding protein [Actinoplanes teichomyceticus]TWG24596.1 NitT/TauT family transport system substrate-binding protein [Actinoplanes teichomyceticus]GIF14741.1 lipoprotein [Actinoplanes teichomyceticus]
MKKLLAALAAASLLLVAACGDGDPAGGGEKSSSRVTFGYIADYNGTSLLAVAQDRKLWAKHGLAVTPKVFTNGPLQVTAMNAGDLDYGYIGPGAVWLPASGKAKIVALNSLGNADRVIAQPQITDLSRLRGKKVGVPEGTSGDMILTLALAKAGLTNTDIQRVPMDPATIVSAFAAGRIDAAGIWYPLLDNIKARKPDLVELARNDDFAAEVAFPTAFVAGNEAARDTARTTKVLQVLREAMDYRAAHPDETAALVAAMNKQTVEAVKADAANSRMLDTRTLDGYTADGTVTRWLTGMGDYFVGAGKLPANPDPKSYYLGDLFTGAAAK